MRSKCIRYSSSRAPRSPPWARSTSPRTAAFWSRAVFAAAVIPSSAIPRRDARRPRPCNAGPGSRGRAEADAALPQEPLHVEHALQGDRVAAVLGVERERGVTRARAEVGGAERLLEGVGAAGRDEGAHDL